MLRLKFVSPFSCYKQMISTPVYRFSSQKGPNNDSKINAEVEQNEQQNTAENQKINQEIIENDKEKQNQVDTKYHYNKGQFNYIQSSDFQQKMQRIADAETMDKNKPRDGYFVTLALCAGAAFIYYLWQTTPYKVMYPHTTVSEYLNQRGNYWAAILSPLSFQEEGHFKLYFPLMAYSIYLTSFFLKQKHMLLIYLLNALITTGSVYFFEKDDRKLSKLLTPKVMGAVTPLCFSSLFLVLKPGHFMLGSRILPFFLIPSIYYMYEFHEYTSVEVNEICREAHLVSIAFGFLAGLVCKPLLLKKII